MHFTPFPAFYDESNVVTENRNLQYQTDRKTPINNPAKLNTTDVIIITTDFSNLFLLILINFLEPPSGEHLFITKKDIFHALKIVMYFWIDKKIFYVYFKGCFGSQNTKL